MLALLDLSAFLLITDAKIDLKNHLIEIKQDFLNMLTVSFFSQETKRPQLLKPKVEFSMILPRKTKKLLLASLSMLFQDSSQELNPSEVLFSTAPKKAKYTEPSDKNGTIKETKEKDLKKLKKQKKRNDSA